MTDEELFAIAARLAVACLISGLLVAVYAIVQGLSMWFFYVGMAQAVVSTGLLLIVTGDDSTGAGG